MGAPLPSAFFFFNDTATTEIYTLSLHDALPIFAAPVAEPVIAGDNAAALRLFRQAALHDELIRCEDELPNPRGRLSGKSFVLLLPFLKQFHIVIGALCTDCFSVEGRCCFRGQNKSGTGTGFAFWAEQRGKKAILAVAQAPLSFCGEITIKIPFVPRLAAGSATLQINWCCAVIRLHLYAAIYRRNIHAPVAGMRQRMEVAIVHERFQFHFKRAASSNQRVLNVSGVFALAHPDALFQERVG